MGGFSKFGERVQAHKEYLLNSINRKLASLEVDVTQDLEPREYGDSNWQCLGRMQQALEAHDLGTKAFRDRKGLESSLFNWSHRVLTQPDCDLYSSLTELAERIADINYDDHTHIKSWMTFTSKVRQSVFSAGGYFSRLAKLSDVISTQNVEAKTLVENMESELHGLQQLVAAHPIEELEQSLQRKSAIIKLYQEREDVQLSVWEKERSDLKSQHWSELTEKEAMLNVNLKHREELQTRVYDLQDSYTALYAKYSQQEKQIEELTQAQVPQTKIVTVRMPVGSPPAAPQRLEGKQGAIGGKVGALVSEVLTTITTPTPEHPRVDPRYHSISSNCSIASGATDFLDEDGSSSGFSGWGTHTQSDIPRLGTTTSSTQCSEVAVNTLPLPVTTTNIVRKRVAFATTSEWQSMHLQVEKRRRGMATKVIELLARRMLQRKCMRISVHFCLRLLRKVLQRRAERKQTSNELIASDERKEMLAWKRKAEALHDRLAGLNLKYQQGADDYQRSIAASKELQQQISQLESQLQYWRRHAHVPPQHEVKVSQASLNALLPVQRCFADIIQLWSLDRSHFPASLPETYKLVRQLRNGTFVALTAAVDAMMRPLKQLSRMSDEGTAVPAAFTSVLEDIKQHTNRSVLPADPVCVEIGLQVSVEEVLGIPPTPPRSPTPQTARGKKMPFFRSVGRHKHKGDKDAAKAKSRTDVEHLILQMNRAGRELSRDESSNRGRKSTKQHRGIGGASSRSSSSMDGSRRSGGSHTSKGKKKKSNTTNTDLGSFKLDRQQILRALLSPPSSDRDTDREEAYCSTTTTATDVPPVIVEPPRASSPLPHSPLSVASSITTPPRTTYATTTTVGDPTGSSDIDTSGTVETTSTTTTTDNCIGEPDATLLPPSIITTGSLSSPTTATEGCVSPTLTSFKYSIVQRTQLDSGSATSGSTVEYRSVAVNTIVCYDNHNEMQLQPQTVDQSTDQQQQVGAPSLATQRAFHNHLHELMLVGDTMEDKLIALQQQLSTLQEKIAKLAVDVTDNDQQKEVMEKLTFDKQLLQDEIAMALRRTVIHTRLRKMRDTLVHSYPITPFRRRQVCGAARALTACAVSYAHILQQRRSNLLQVLQSMSMMEKSPSKGSEEPQWDNASIDHRFLVLPNNVSTHHRIPNESCSERQARLKCTLPVRLNKDSTSSNSSSNVVIGNKRLTQELQHIHQLEILQHMLQQHKKEGKEEADESPFDIPLSLLYLDRDHASWARWLPQTTMCSSPKHLTPTSPAKSAEQHIKEENGRQHSGNDVEVVAAAVEATTPPNHKLLGTSNSYSCEGNSTLIVGSGSVTQPKKTIKSPPKGKRTSSYVHFSSNEVPCAGGDGGLAHGFNIPMLPPQAFINPMTSPHRKNKPTPPSTKRCPKSDWAAFGIHTRSHRERNENLSCI